MSTSLEGQIASALLNTFHTHNVEIHSGRLLLEFRRLGMPVDQGALLDVLNEFASRQAISLRATGHNPSDVIVTAIHPSLAAFL